MGAVLKPKSLPKKSKEPNQLFEFLNDLNFSKQNILTEENQGQYAPFVINRFISGSYDSVQIANEMNLRPFLDTRMQYDFYLNMLRKRKRYSKWIKAEADDDLVGFVCTLYSCSPPVARSYIKLMTPEQKESIKLDYTDHGGPV